MFNFIPEKRQSDDRPTSIIIRQTRRECCDKNFLSEVSRRKNRNSKRIFAIQLRPIQTLKLVLRKTIFIWNAAELLSPVNGY